MLKTPPFLIAAALALWTWRTGWWIPAVVMAALFEGSRYVKFRWDFTDKEYSRIFDVCTLLFAGSTVYLRFAEEITRSGFLLFQWMPVLFALMLLAQSYGTRDKIPYRVYSWFARLRKDKPEPNESGLNSSWPYFGICLLAAGATNTLPEERTLTFYFAVIALCAWAAWTTRIRRYTTPIWAACAIAVAAIGFVGQAGWVGFQNLMTPLLGQAFARWSAKEFDATSARTSMGEVGSKKNSGKIVLRVKSIRGRTPTLLRQASYDTLKDIGWNATGRDWIKNYPENDTTTWILTPEATNTSAVRISGYLRGRQGLLSLPQGTTRLLDLPVAELETSPLGAARAKQGPGVISFQAEFVDNKSIDRPPDGLDEKVPPAEQPVITQIADEIKSKSATNALALVQAVERYFTQNFSYSLYHKENAAYKGSPLSNFLTNTHTGHCEYFASATTLLLRQLGIPARYAVGYSLQEMKGDTIIVRERHAHAWVLAWLNGAWREIDTTPGTWFGMEREQAPRLEWLSDFFSDLWFKFNAWRWLGQKGFISRMAPYLVLPLVAILIWRIFFRKKRVEQKRVAKQTFNWPGLDSEYYELEARLAASGHERHPYETPAQFLARLQSDGITHPSIPALIDLHYRYRFAPQGLDKGARTTLRQLSQKELISSDKRVP
jgi:transglutaminase-like putative cysteine protease